MGLVRGDGHLFRRVLLGLLGTFVPYSACDSRTIDNPNSPARKARSIKLCTILEGPFFSLRMIVSGVTPRITANSFCVSSRLFLRFFSCSPVIFRALRIANSSAMDLLIQALSARISDCSSVFNPTFGHDAKGELSQIKVRISHLYICFKGLRATDQNSNLPCISLIVYQCLL